MLSKYQRLRYSASKTHIVTLVNQSSRKRRPPRWIPSSIQNAERRNCSADQGKTPNALLIPFPPISHSVYPTQQLRLEDELPLLVLLRRFKRLVILPPHRVPALPAPYVAHHVPARRHAALHGVFGQDVDDGGEKVGFAVLAAEVL